jgi:hypothetical protein
VSWRQFLLFGRNGNKKFLPAPLFFLVFVELGEEEVKELEQEIERPGIKIIVIPIGVL